jgi:hypothetical protein
MIIHLHCKYFDCRVKPRYKPVIITAVDEKEAIKEAPECPFCGSKMILTVTDKD